MFKTLLLFFFFIGSLVQAQTVQIIDSDSKTPISNAAFFNAEKNTSAVSDLQGNVDLSDFEENENIFITHISHRPKTTTKAQIMAKNGQILLDSDENQLGEVILSVAKFEQDREVVSHKINTITPEQIAFRNPQTAADLLSNSGEVYVQKSQLGGGSPMIRGFSTNRLLLTVDGVRMNTAIFRSGNLQNVINIDPFALDHTEVILGPGSVVYGSDAIGGVINFYTTKPQFSTGNNQFLSGNAVARYSTANEEKTGHVDFNFGTKKWAFFSSASYSDYDDLRMGAHGPADYLRPDYVDRINGEDVQVINDNPNVQVPTGFDQLNLMQKVRFMPNETWEYNLGVIYSTTSNYSRYDRLTRKRGDQLRSAEWYYGPQNWFFSNFQIDKKGYGPLYDKAKLTVAFQNFEESRHDRNFGDDILFETEEMVDAYSAALDFTKELGKHQLFYGLEYVFNDVSSSGKQTNILDNTSIPDASRYPDGSTWQSAAAYVSGQFHLAENMNLQSGLRYDQVLVDATFDDRFYDFPFSNADINTGNLTGSLGLNWQASQILGWRFNVSTAFRAPNIDDVGKIFDSEPGSVVVPNPDLKAEYAYNYEIGLNLNFEEVVKVDLAGFYTYLDNALVRRDFNLGGETLIDYQGEPSNVQAIQNAASAKVVGLEAGVDILFNKNMNLSSQINIIEGSQEEDDGSTAPLRHAAPLFGNTHLVWKNDRLKFDAFAEYNGQLNADELAPSQVGNSYLYALNADGDPYAPRWYTLNFATQYKLNQTWQLTAALENITDQRYRPYSSGISAPGRNFIVAVKVGF
ncbi:TonB-dependent receptor [Flavimarina sp. Hel_I_48]|uniref:TonB-dependent receptor n=1 Tax=Flavimarina sp. Hel_I_48 TaxID=1392488 RepID=UPI0004DF4B47|nr:TonB-dependent receptor [Flavimarina sp. Hel_I_48]